MSKCDNTTTRFAFRFSLHLLMPSMRNNASTSTPSYSKSRSDSGLKQQGQNDAGFQLFDERQLTRQRKLRHLSDAELWLCDRAHSSPVSPKLRSLGGLEQRSFSPVPQPLPLPQPLKREGLSDSGQPGSPNEEPVYGDGTGDGPQSSSGYVSDSGGRIIRSRRNKDHVATRLAKPSTNCPIGFSLDLNAECAHYNMGINIPSRSAPCSVFASPSLSPGSLSTGDFYPVAPRSRRCNFWSAQVIPVRDAPSPNQYLLDSWTFQSPGCKSTTRPESSSHVNVHPLPIPPRALISSQSANIRYILENPSASAMKSQWLKRKLIGCGTFGSVYVATNRETGALCAMKEVNIIPDDPKSAECIKQLEQEIKVLSQLKHPNIVRYYGSETVDDHFYIYMEYIYPGSINKFVREYCEAISESVVRNFTRHILNGLAYLHSNNTIHRDIKGANLLVNARGIVKLADFGMAKHLTGPVYDLSLKGSPHWMAPEVMRATLLKDQHAKADLAFAVDIWSLGCTIIEMLNGKPPWSELDGNAAMFKVLNKSPPIPESLSPEGKDFLQCCFIRDPSKRPSAKDLLNHRFLRNLHDYNASMCGQALSGNHLADKAHNLGDSVTQTIDTWPISLPPIKQLSNKNSSCNRETSKHCYAETCSSPVPCLHLPPTHAALPGLSLRSKENVELETLNNCPRALSRFSEREVPHL